MSLLDDILAHNREYVEDQNTGYVDTDTKCSKMPSREMAIVTCMDTRLVNFLEDSMDIGRGEAKIVKTAGNCITCLLYTSPSPRDYAASRMPSSA